MAAVGVTQVGGPPETGPSTWQQMSPTAQQVFPQQSELGAQIPAVWEQGGTMHVPLLQKGVAVGH
jgi:hypothetical protein